MNTNFEDEILSMERMKYLTNMSVERFLKYDKSEISDHYDEIASILCFLDEQISEKVRHLSEVFYGS